PSGPGTYTFYLNVTDRVGSTSSATVVVTVEPALAVGTVSAVPNPLDVGQSATIATTGATGGTGSYTYVWTGLPPGCPDPGNVTSFACAPSIGGVYAVLVTVTDGNGASATGGVSVLVSSVLSVGAPLAAPNPVDAGQTATLSTTGASGGTGPYTYLWTGLPPGCPNPGNVTSFACAPSSAGTFTVLLTVTDSAGNSAGVTLTLVVDPALSAGTLVATRTTLDVGQPTSVSTSGVGGGLAPYTYAWTGLPTGCANPGDTSAFGCAPTAAGTFDVQLLVTDANGASATASIVLTVDPPLLVVPTASLNPVHVGQTTTLFAGASGGSGVYTTYLWSAPPQLGCLLGTTASISCTPTVTGTFTLSISATDSNGATATGALAVTAVAVVPGVYTVTVSGGPSGHVWYLNLSNGQTFQSSGPALNFTEPNGTYGYEFGGTVVGSRVLSALPGTFVVQGGPVNLQPSFVPCRGVVLIEKGLPPGMEWWANFTGGYPFFSFGTTMALFLPPGTWTYTLHATNPDYAVRGHTLTVKGPITKILKPTRYTLKFKLETFVVRFTETGLPPGSRWCVVMKGLGTFCGRGGQVHFRAPNGTYSYSLTTTAVGFSGAGGTIVVHGPGTQPVSFSTTGGGLPAVGPAAPRSASSRSSGLSAVLVALGAVAGLGVGAMGRRGRSEVGPGAG
ncbi:MAG TPA: hypothetical protein VEH10_05300, partial [Thermoplasmata archaeon]|nr:hypothetical protein [Thermoplasmata archaeon]